jgi:hypothetical protein
MIKSYKIATWNAKGMAKHSQMKTSIFSQDIDILHVSKIHFINKSYCRIPGYTLYHPDGKTHGVTVLIIRSNIKHYEIGKYQREYLQVTSIVVEDRNSCITISAYSPPKHAINRKHYITFFKTFDNRLIAVGDYNVEHTYWKSRLILLKGCKLFKAIEDMNLTTLSIR